MFYCIALSGTSPAAGANIPGNVIVMLGIIPEVHLTKIHVGYFKCQKLCLHDNESWWHYPISTIGRCTPGDGLAHTGLKMEIEQLFIYNAFNTPGSMITKCLMVNARFGWMFTLIPCHSTYFNLLHFIIIDLYSYLHTKTIMNARQN